MIDRLEDEATVSEIKDLGDLCTTGVRLKLAMDVTEGDVLMRIDRRNESLLALEFTDTDLHVQDRHGPPSSVAHGAQWRTGHASDRASQAERLLGHVVLIQTLPCTGYTYRAVSVNVPISPHDT